MARPRIADFWIKKIREEEVATPGIRAPRIAEILSGRLANETLKVPKDVSAKVPDERTIRNVLKIPLDEKERASYRRFQWPESMINGFLPWEASRVALDLFSEFKKRGWPRPTNDQARWFWRLTLASPDMPILQQIEFAVNLAEIGEANISEMAGIARTIESRFTESGPTYDGAPLKCHQCGLTPENVITAFVCEACGGPLVFKDQSQASLSADKQNKKGRSRGRKRSTKKGN